MAAVVRLPLEKRLDRQIDICRFGARRDHVTVIIERHTTRKDGSVRRTPILELTPDGDIREIDAAPLRVAIAAHMADAHLTYLEGGMNARASAGHERFNELSRQSADYIAAARAAVQERRGRRQERHEKRVGVKA